MTNKWRPDAKDMLDYANNVEHLYNQLQKDSDSFASLAASRGHNPGLQRSQQSPRAAPVQRHRRRNRRVHRRLRRG